MNSFFELDVFFPTGFPTQEKENFQFCFLNKDSISIENKWISKISTANNIECPNIPLIDCCSLDEIQIDQEDNMKIPLNIHIPVDNYEGLPKIILEELKNKNIKIENNLKIFLLVQKIPSKNKDFLSFKPQYGTDGPWAPSKGKYWAIRKIKTGIFCSDSQNIHFEGHKKNEFFEEIISVRPQGSTDPNDGIEGKIVLSRDDLHIKGVDPNVGQEFWSYVGYHDGYNEKAIATLHWIINSSQLTTLLNHLSSFQIRSPIKRNKITRFFRFLKKDLAFKNAKGGGVSPLTFLDVFKTPAIKRTPSKLLILTIPKSGTHFIQNFLPKFGYTHCFSLHSGGFLDEDHLYQDDLIPNLKKAFNPSGHLLPIKGKIYHVDSGITLLCKKTFEKMAGKIQPGMFAIGHLQYDKKIAEIFKKNNVKIILLLRNPEETAVSNYNWNMKEAHPLTEYFSSLTLEEGIHKIFFGIDRYEAEVPCDFVPLRWQYNLYTDWILKHGAFPVFFEDIIGLKGGGSFAKQKKIIKEMFAYLKEPIPSDNKIKKILDESYGNSMTFRIGKAAELPDEIKEIFGKEPIKSEVQKINKLLNRCKKSLNRELI
jgi:hypothetical protein